MSQVFNCIALQMTSTPDPNSNIDWVETMLNSAPVLPQSIVVLPECFSCFGARDNQQHAIKEPLAGGALTSRLKALAQKHRIHLFAGTMPMTSSEPERFYAACRYINSAGEQCAVYNKIHLFDVHVADKTGSYKESSSTKAGDQVVVININNVKIGIAVCYDVRFPGLFEAMGEIDVLVLPAAFTHHTGAAHWETLIRARAIEKQCFVVAANQTGVHENGRQTYGHSMIVSPWGEILAQETTLAGIIQAQIDISMATSIRQKMPIAQHNKFRSHFVE